MARLVVATLCLCLLGGGSARADDADDLATRLAQADGLLWVALAEGGRVQTLADALSIVSEVETRMEATTLPEEVRAPLRDRIEALRVDLENLHRASGFRFVGSFPLVRLVEPVSDEAVTETFRRDPALEAVRGASQRVVDEVVRLQYPHVVFRSVPVNRALESEALRVFAQADRPFAHSRAEVVGALDTAQVKAYDRGELDARGIARLCEAFGAEKLLVLTLREDVSLPDATMVVLEGVFYARSSAEPSDSFAHMGFARDRRDQLGPVMIAQVLLLVLALLLAVSTPWSRVRPWPLPRRLVVGAGLFVLGRVLAILLMVAGREIMPAFDAPAAPSVWWPAAVGIVVFLGTGFLGWLVKTRVVKSLPGGRTSRAVGTIYAVTALGAIAYFAEPLLLLDPVRGPALLPPLAIVTILLAGLTGYAARTGPPVPTWFLVGPLLGAALVGLALFAMDARGLWGTALLGVLLVVLAVVRHKVAVARGTEEPEMDEEDAERVDAERLEKVAKGLQQDLKV